VRENPADLFDLYSVIASNNCFETVLANTKKLTGKMKNI